MQADLLESGMSRVGERVSDEHGHPDASQELREAGADRPEADHSSRLATDLKPGSLGGLQAIAVVEGGIADVTGNVEHQGECQLGSRRDEALVGVTDQHARRRRRADVDRADVDGAAQEGDEGRKCSEEVGVSRRRSVGDDDVTLAGRFDQLAGRQVAIERVEHDACDRLQLGQRSSEVRVTVFSIVRDEHRKHRS